MVKAKVRMLRPMIRRVAMQPIIEELWGSATRLGLAPKQSKYLQTRARQFRALLPTLIFFLVEYLALNRLLS